MSKNKTQMIIINKNLPLIVKKKVDSQLKRFKAYLKKIAPKIAFGILILLILTQKEFSFHITFGGAAPATVLNTSSSTSKPPKPQFVSNSKKINATLLPSEKKWWQKIKTESQDIRTKLNLANEATAVGAALTPEQQKKAASYSNLGFILNPDFAREHGVSQAIVNAKNQICFDYIKRYSATAIQEANLFNIPASITLAQGLLESNAGKSALAAKENNHFGIKCKAKCQGCRCANYTDDSKFDMFRVFDSAWDSFREHSKILANTRYKHLTSLKKTDYKNWAHGLQAAGYATDKKYASKLIAIIEALELYRFDN